MVDKVPQGFFVKSARLYRMTEYLKHYMVDRQQPTTTYGKIRSAVNSGSQFNNIRRYGKARSVQLRPERLDKYSCSCPWLP